VPFVETANEIGSVLEVGGRLPRRMVVTDPTNEILQGVAAPEVTRVQNFSDFPLFLVVDYHRRRFRLRVELAWARVGGRGFEERNVEDRVDLHSRGKVQLMSVGGDLCENSESCQTLEV
jgi:hypothetical protein